MRRSLVYSNTRCPKRLAFKNLIVFLGIFSIAAFSYNTYSQDSLDFRMFDTLKTSAEDSHKTTGSNLYKNSSEKVPQNNRYKDKDNFDISLFRTINNSRSNFKDGLFNIVDRSMLPVCLILPAAAFTYGRIADKTYDENTGYLLGTSILTNIIVTASLKYTIKRVRPRNALNNVYTREENTDRYSFPSGHASSSFATAGMFALRYPKYPQVYVPMYLWALAVTYGRPYFAMHYPSDLLAGALIGTGSSVLIYSLSAELFKLKNNVLNETKKDEGSINGGTLSIFAGTFVLSTLFNEFVIRYDKDVKFNVLPQSQGMTLNINWGL